MLIHPLTQYVKNTFEILFVETPLLIGFSEYRQIIMQNVANAMSLLHHMQIKRNKQE